MSDVVPNDTERQRRELTINDHWMRSGTLLALTGGHWEVPPLPGWDPSGLVLTRFSIAPRRLIIVRGDDFRHGLPPGALASAAAFDCALMLAQDTPQPRWHGPILRVPSLRPAMRAIARYARSRYAGTVIGITGSVGKSSTTAMLARALEVIDGSCYHSDYKRNTHDGVLGQTCNLAAQRYAAMEVSASRTDIARVLRPHLSIITAIAPAHLSYLRDLETIADVKSALFRALEPGGTAVLCRDIPLYDRVYRTACEHASRVITYGQHPAADLRLLGFEAGKVSADIAGTAWSYQLGELGPHQAINSLGAIAALRALDLDWRMASHSFQDASFPEGRGQRERLDLGGRAIQIIDDSGNANPASMRAAFVVLGAITTPSRRIAVLGDMLELGTETGRLHAELAESLRAANVDQMYLFGEAMCDHLAPMLPPAILAACERTDLRALRRQLQTALQHGDVVLFKASQGTGVHQIVKRLRRGG